MTKINRCNICFAIIECGNVCWNGCINKSEFPNEKEHEIILKSIREFANKFDNELLGLMEKCNKGKK